MGLETTLKRGIINTRDEPHADADKYRRLHVIIGDANLAEMSTYLKVGTTALVLDLIEAGVDLTDLQLARPVTAVHHISHDPTLRATVALADGRELTGLALQRIYLDRVAKHVDREGDDDPRAADIIDKWAMVLDLLERDPMECAHLLDWPAKLRLLEGFRSREGLAWSAPRLHMTTCSTPTCDSRRACTTAWSRVGPWSAWSPNSRCSTRYTTPDRYPARSSAANACAASVPTSPRPAGIR